MLINRILFLVFMVVLLQACKKDSYPILENDDRLISLIGDLHIADIAVNKFALAQRDSVRMVYKQQISELYGLSENGLDSVSWILQNDFKRYNKLYAQLRDTMTILEGFLQRRNEAEAKKVEPEK